VSAGFKTKLFAWGFFGRALEKGVFVEHLLDFLRELRAWTAATAGWIAATAA
jgi:hypothetical protein